MYVSCFLSLLLPVPLPQLPKIMKIQHGGYNLTTNRDSTLQATCTMIISEALGKSYTVYMSSTQQAVQNLVLLKI